MRHRQFAQQLSHEILSTVCATVDAIEYSIKYFPVDAVGVYADSLQSNQCYPRSAGHVYLRSTLFPPMAIRALRRAGMFSTRQIPTTGGHKDTSKARQQLDAGRMFLAV